MRRTFIDTLITLAEDDPRIVLMTGDLGFSVLEDFMARFPERYYNVGVAEQNMVGLATGLAEAGFIPFCYSIVTFAALRPYEFIRNGAILHQLPVRIVAIGGGYEYGAAGPTHHGLEDVGVMRVQPGINVIAPADYKQTKTALLKTWDAPQPIYYRLGKNDKVEVAGLDGRFEVGRLQVVREGGDVLLLAMGGIALDVMDAAGQLAATGIEATVAVVASMHPAPVDDLRDLLARFPAAVTVEAHYVNGGLGSLVCEVAAENGLGVRVTRCGIRSTPDGLSGSQANMHQRHGIDAGSVVEVARRVLAVSR